MKSFITAVEEVAAEADGTPIKEQLIEFEVDGRVIHAHQPTEGQLAFFLASVGRGQSDTQRFASMVNVVLETLQGEDKDYMEGRLLTRDPKQRMSIKTLEQIFEFLMEEWFGRPTESPSDSA